MIYLPLLLVDELSFRVRDLMVGPFHTKNFNSGFRQKNSCDLFIYLLIHSQEIRSSTVQLPLTVSYEGISLRRFRFWVHLQDVVYSLRQFGERLQLQPLKL